MPMRSTRYILAIGALAVAIAGCTARPETSVNANRNAGLNADVNASLDADDDNEVNGSVNAGRNAGSNRIPPAVIYEPDGGPAGNLQSEDANIEADLNVLGASDSDAEISEMEQEINAE